MNCGVFFSNLWNFFHCPDITRTEKILVPILTLLYWIWPLDVLPGLLIDDLGVTGLAMAYMNWRVMQTQQKPGDGGQTKTVEPVQAAQKPEEQQKYLPQSQTQDHSTLPSNFFHRSKRS